MIMLTEKTLVNLREWLISRESDITFGMEDLGDLKPLFYEIMHRLPVKDKPALKTHRNARSIGENKRLKEKNI